MTFHDGSEDRSPTLLVQKSSTKNAPLATVTSSELIATITDRRVAASPRALSSHQKQSTSTGIQISPESNIHQQRENIAPNVRILDQEPADP